MTLPSGLYVPPALLAGETRHSLRKIRERLGAVYFEVWRAACDFRDARIQALAPADDPLAYEVCFSGRDVMNRVNNRVPRDPSERVKISKNQADTALKFLEAFGLLEISRKRRVFPREAQRDRAERKRPKRENACAWRAWRVVYGAWNQDQTVTLPGWVVAGLDERDRQRKASWKPKVISPEGLARCAQGGRHSGAVRRAKRLGVPVEEILGAPLPPKPKRVRVAAAVVTARVPTYQQARAVVTEFKARVECARRAVRAQRKAEEVIHCEPAPAAPARTIGPNATHAEMARHLWGGDKTMRREIMLEAIPQIDALGALCFGGATGPIGRTGLMPRLPNIVVPAAKLLPDDATEMERAIILWRLIDGCLRENKLRRPSGWGKPGSAFDRRIKACRQVEDAADALYVRKIAPAAWLDYHVGEFMDRLKEKTVRAKDFSLSWILSSKFIMQQAGWHARLAGALNARIVPAPADDTWGARVSLCQFVVGRNGHKIKADPSLERAIERVFFPRGYDEELAERVARAEASSALLRADAATGAWVWGRDPFNPGA